MQVLGIWDGHDAGVAWWRDGHYVCCLSEERLSRNKRQTGFPSLALNHLIQSQGLDPERIDVVAIPGRYGRLPMRWADRQYRAQSDGQDPLSLSAAVIRNADVRLSHVPVLRSLESEAGLKPVRGRLQRAGIVAPIVTVQHHDAHAHTALCSPDDGPLVVTLDGYGDGECGRLAYHTGRERRLRAPEDSVALVYGAITSLLGFSEGDEGKVMGLAALGDPEALRDVFEKLLKPGDCKVGLGDARIRRRLLEAKREDVAAALQARVESLVLRWVREVRHGEAALAVSGGLFANVALNGKLKTLFERLYVFPHMGDGGLCVGAVESVVRQYAFPSVPFLGPEWPDGTLRAALDASGLTYHAPADPEAPLADTVISGKIAARWFGRSEFGPRALGHRSIFIRADMPSLVDALNQQLGRDDFMPFAPIRRRGAGSPTMTVVFQADEDLCRGARAAVHHDGTCRTQLVSEQVDIGLWRLLSITEAHGLPAIINTSFNLHGEPIVESPVDAIRTFLSAGLDRLQLGPYIVDKPC